MEINDSASDSIVTHINTTIKHLLNAILESKKEIRQKDAEIKELQEKLLLYMQTSHVGISRHEFRSFFMTVTNREETNEEWNMFIQTFHYNTLPHVKQIYAWIDKYLDK